MIVSLLLALLLQPDPAALLPLYRQALAEQEKRHGPGHPSVGRAASDLGLYLQKLGDREGALRHLRQALAIYEKMPGGKHPAVFETLEHLASLTPPAEAIKLLRRASAAHDDALAARAAGKLGDLEERAGNRDAAIAAYRQALEREEKASGKEHPRVAVRLNDLALALEPSAAEPLLRRAVSIQRAALGEAHPETAVTLNNLGNVLLAGGRLEEAERVHRASLAGLEGALGAGHPRVAVSCSNLADVLRARGDVKSAKALYQRALGIYEKIYGPEHPEVAAELENLASLLEQTGESTEAARIRRRLEEIRSRR